jgi:hypothetical protein
MLIYSEEWRMHVCVTDVQLVEVRGLNDEVKRRGIFIVDVLSIYCEISVPNAEDKEMGRRRVEM